MRMTAKQSAEDHARIRAAVMTKKLSDQGYGWEDIILKLATAGLPADRVRVKATVLHQ